MHSTAGASHSLGKSVVGLHSTAGASHSFFPSLHSTSGASHSPGKSVVGLHRLQELHVAIEAGDSIAIAHDSSSFAEERHFAHGSASNAGYLVNRVRRTLNRAAEMEDNAAVALPVIDLGGLSCDDPSARARIARELRDATEEWGFFQVFNHTVTDELQEQARQIFDLPLDVKKRAQNDGPNLRFIDYKELPARGGQGCF